MPVQTLEVTNAEGHVVAEAWLAQAETVHRQLRPQLPENYGARMQEIFAGGARMLVAINDERVVGVAVWRIIDNTFAGKVFYVDDLVTDEQTRSSGVGQALLQHCERLAMHMGCPTFELDSGCQRTRAHKFYFREGMIIGGFHFYKALKSGN